MRFLFKWHLLQDGGICEQKWCSESFDSCWPHLSDLVKLLNHQVSGAHEGPVPLCPDPELPVAEDNKSKWDSQWTSPSSKVGVVTMTGEHEARQHHHHPFVFLSREASNVQVGSNTVRKLEVNEVLDALGEAAREPKSGLVRARMPSCDRRPLKSCDPRGVRMFGANGTMSCSPSR